MRVSIPESINNQCHEWFPDEIWRIKHVRKFDKQNFDKLSYVYICAAKNK